MALPTQGKLSLGDIATEFGGTAPHSMSEYFGAAAGIPSQGAVGFGNFYGATAAKIETIIIPASETGVLFTGDSKNTGPAYNKNIAATPYHTNVPTNLTYDSTMYTKYSRFAADLGYSSVFISIIPAVTGLYAIPYFSRLQVFLTSLPPNTASNPDFFTYQYTPRTYTQAGNDLIKSIKVTKLGVTANLSSCRFSTKLAGSQPLTNLPGLAEHVLDNPIWTSYLTSTGDYHIYDPNVGDFPIDWITGPQQYSVEIEWV